MTKEFTDTLVDTIVPYKTSRLPWFFANLHIKVMNFEGTAAGDNVYCYTHIQAIYY